MFALKHLQGAGKEGKRQKEKKRKPCVGSGAAVQLQLAAAGPGTGRNARSDRCPLHLQGRVRSQVPVGCSSSTVLCFMQPRI